MQPIVCYPRQWGGAMSPLDESEDEGKMEENTNPHIDFQVMPEVSAVIWKSGWPFHQLAHLL